MDPNGLATEYFFKYGTNATPYWDQTGKTAGAPGRSPVTASDRRDRPHGRDDLPLQAVRRKHLGHRQGSDLTFTTTGPPLATTSAATPVSNTAATLKGSVNPRGHATKYFFKYGKTTPYGQKQAPHLGRRRHVRHPVSRP